MCARSVKEGLPSVLAQYPSVPLNDSLPAVLDRTLPADSQGILSCDARPGYAADPLVLDERGCLDMCTAVDPATQELMVGRYDGVYFYTTEDRGGAVGFDGTKEVVGCLRGFILVASVDAR